jgi:GNAT superfamily N-acetyltransferase
MRMSDAEPLQDMMYRLSDDSVYRRFLAHKHSHPNDEIIKLCDLDYQQSMALVGCAGADDREVVAVARYDVDPRTRLADIAFVVRDDWQGHGLGTRLLQKMIAAARARGLEGFTADVLASNRPMLIIFQRSGLQVQSERSGNVYRLTARF